MDSLMSGSVQACMDIRCMEKYFSYIFHLFELIQHKWESDCSPIRCLRCHLSYSLTIQSVSGTSDRFDVQLLQMICQYPISSLIANGDSSGEFISI